jgi:hypothetical protein
MLRNISITTALNGFIVNVGCQTVVFDSRKKLLKALKAYLEDPEKFEEEFVKEKGFNHRHTMDGAPLRIGTVGTDAPQQPRVPLNEENYGRGMGGVLPAGNVLPPIRIDG